MGSFNQRARDSSSLERTKKPRRFVRVFAVFSFPESLHTTGADIENAIVHCYNKIVVLSPKIQDAKRLQLANIQEERMVTGAIKNKVDKIWTDIWAGGITNPLTVIEQLTYLMFIRSLDEKELATEDFENMAGEKMEHIFPASVAGQSMRWSRFKDKDSREIFLTMQQRVFPAIKKMKYGRLPDFDANGELVEIEDDPTRPDEGNTAFARYMDDAMFLIPTPQVLQKIITGLEDLYTHDIADLDMQGDLYEYMLGKLATAGQNGQFRTPKHIRDMIVELVQPTPDDLICDPACGTAGFLVSSAQYLRAHYEDSMTPEQWQHFAGPMFTGFDMDRTMLRISAMNLMLHSITNPDIDYKDSVSKQNSICSKYTVCLAIILTPILMSILSSENAQRFNQSKTYFTLDLLIGWHSTLLRGSRP